MSEASAYAQIIQDNPASDSFLNLMQFRDDVTDFYEVINEIERREEKLCVITRLMMSKREDEIPAAVHEYLKEIGMEGLSLTLGTGMGGGGVISSIINGIKKSIAWLTDIAIDLFRRIFDQYYRAQRKFMKYQSECYAVTEEAKKLAIQETVLIGVNKDDLKQMIRNIVEMNKEVQSASAVSVADHIDRFVETATNVFMCSYINGKLFDNSKFTMSTNRATVVDHGYTFNDIKEMASSMVALSGENVTTKVTEKNTLRLIKEMESDLNRALARNDDPVLLTNTQEKIADKRRIATFITSSLSVIMNRFSMVETEFDKLMVIVKTAR